MEKWRETGDEKSTSIRKVSYQSSLNNISHDTTIANKLALLGFAGTETNELIRRSDEGLTREKSALKSLYGGEITSSILLVKPNIRSFCSIEFSDCFFFFLISRAF